MNFDQSVKPYLCVLVEVSGRLASLERGTIMLVRTTRVHQLKYKWPGNLCTNGPGTYVQMVRERMYKWSRNVRKNRLETYVHKTLLTWMIFDAKKFNAMI